MLATLGDLVEDVVVQLQGPLNPASDTRARITRRRGGSAANVASAAGEAGAAVRFLGQVGDDPMGALLITELAASGVDTSSVRRAGVTGTIVVVVDVHGERSMLSDRRTCLELANPDLSWLEGVTTLHVPLYSLTEGPLATTARTMIDWARNRGIAVSIDASSVAVMEEFGVQRTLEVLAELEPTILFANDDEARVLGITSALGAAITVVKRGPRPAVVHLPGQRAVEVPAVVIDHVRDSTGAGDAFAAGFLTFVDDRAGDGGPQAAPAWVRDPVAACRAGHRTAAGVLTGR